MKLKLRIILFSGIVLAVFGNSAKLPAQESFPVIPHVEQTPVVDGVLDDPVWSQALIVQLYYADADKPGEPDNPTTAYALTAQENGEEYIYFAFKCIENHPDGPFIANPEHRRGPHPSMPPLEVSDFVQVKVAFGRWGRFAYYLFDCNTSNTPFSSNTGWSSKYWTTDDWRKETATITGIGTKMEPVPSYQCQSKIFDGYWCAEMKASLKDLILYSKDGIPKYMEIEFFRERIGDDRDKMISNTGNLEDDTLIICDEVLAYWKYFYNYVQSWTRMPNPHRFLPEIYHPEINKVYNRWRAIPNLLWFQLVKLQAGTIENKLVSREDTLPDACFSGYGSYNYTQEERNRLRIEWFEDTRPPRPVWKGDVPLIQTQPLQYQDASFTQSPEVTTTDEGVLIRFASSEKIDVAVAIVDSQGRIIRHLASGVIGLDVNSPEPLVSNSLAQEILWDWKDDGGNIVSSSDYKVKVSLGLTPKYTLLLSKDNISDYDAHITETAVCKVFSLGSDIHPVTPDIAIAHHGHQSNLIYVDPKTEEVYMGGFYIYDGLTGNLKRQVNLCEKLPSITNPELIVGPDDNWWVTGWCDLRRYDKSGNKVAWDALQSNIHPRLSRGNDNPHRGLCFGPANDLYLVHNYAAHCNNDGLITKIGFDGRVKQWGLVEVPSPIQGVKVDRQGYIYTSCVLYPKSQFQIPTDFAPEITNELNRYFRGFYGSVVKFSPQGGKIFYGEGNYQIYNLKANLLGGVWVHPWMSPVLSRDEDKTFHCNCEQSRFDLDPFERLWIPDALRSRIEITDKNANTIKIIGQYGLLEDNNAEDIYFGFPMAVSVSDKACYVGDFFYRRGIKLGITYREEASADIDYIDKFAIITPPSLTQITQGENISITLETINSVSHNLQWQIIDGVLPPGVSIDSNSGIISGKPAQAGTYTFTLKVQDGALQECAKTFTVAVAALPELTLVTNSLYNALLNYAYYCQLSAEGGTPPYIWSIISGSLPEGLKLNTEAGYIYGTVPKLQSSSFKIELNDSTTPVAKTVAKDFSITVKQAGVDCIAPSAIKDLKTDSVSSTYLTLLWTATGNDETQGHASYYDLRYSTTAISESASVSEKDMWWNNAKKTAGLPVPKEFGLSEQFIIYGLRPDTSYYFAIKAIDAADNVSGISNIAYVQTKPQPVIDTVKVRAQCSGQGCYNSLSQWQAQYPNRDLVGQNKILIVECYNDWPQGLNDRVVITGWTTDPDHYIKIMAAPGHETKGIPYSGFRMFQPTSQSESATLEISNWYVKLQGIEVENKNKGVAVACKYSNYLEIESCLLEADSIGTCYFPWPVFYQDYQCDYLKMWNTIIRQKNPLRDCLRIANYKQKAFLYNVIAEGGAIGFNVGSGQAVLKNCVAYSNTTGFSGSVYVDSANNASSDGTAPGKNPQTGVSASDFINAAGGDYHMAESSAKLRNKGIDLSADPYIAFTADITGTTRGQECSWDIGAYEFVPSLLIGDINSDGEINVLDIQSCVNHVLGLQDWGTAADVNSDGNTDVLDVQKLVNLILSE